MTVLFLLLTGAVVGSALPLLLARNEGEHTNYSIIMIIACGAWMIITGLIALTE